MAIAYANEVPKLYDRGITRITDVILKVLTHDLITANVTG